MKKAVITGANGFLGSALCRELSAQGVAITAVVRSKDSDVSRIINLKNLQIVFADMSEMKNLDRIIRDRDADVFYHFAWEGSCGPLRGDYAVQLDNVKYTCDAAVSCKKIGCSRFVSASSIMAYEAAAMMQTEQNPPLPMLYSAANLCAGYMARTAAAAAGADYIHVVISNVYGPGETNQRLVNESLRKMLNGEHCSFSSGEQLYDFIYIDDAAKELAAVGDRGHANRTYYIGSLKPRPLKDFLKEINIQAGRNPADGLGELTFEGVSLAYSEFDIEAVKKDTGIVPEISFAEGIRRTIAWIRENRL